MITTGYGICVVVSTLATLIMALRNYDNIDRYNWSVVILLPFLIIAYWLKAQISEAEASLVLFAFIELMTSLLLSVIMFSMLHSAGIRIRVWGKALIYGTVTILLFPIWRSKGN